MNYRSFAITSFCPFKCQVHTVFFFIYFITEYVYVQFLSLYMSSAHSLIIYFITEYVYVQFLSL